MCNVTNSHGASRKTIQILQSQSNLNNLTCANLRGSAVPSPLVLFAAVTVCYDNEYFM